jgi:hypothetical protein
METRSEGEIMGQYWRAVNLDKYEFLNPYTFNHGAKLWEHLACHPGVGAALIVLCAAQPECRGGGDLDMDMNWHGPERVDMTKEGMTKEGPHVEGYEEIARRTIGRWAGDRIALVGDYSEEGDLPREDASKIYSLCRQAKDLDPEDDPKDFYADISADVKVVLDHELHNLK